MVAEGIEALGAVDMSGTKFPLADGSPEGESPRSAALRVVAADRRGDTVEVRKEPALIDPHEIELIA
jgi:phage terminase large subunit-like protein